MYANTVQAFNGATGANQWRSNGIAGDVQAIDEHDGAVFFGFHDGLFRDKGDGTLPGDPYKVASLNASNGVLLSDPTHGSGVCGPDQDAENCWAPRSVNVAASMWGVIALAHYTSSSGTRLLVGGEVRQWESGGSPVTNSGFFTSFPSVTWTPWLDRDDPSGNGEGEHLSIFVSEGRACANPQAVECRRISDGMPADQTGEVLTCSTSAGLVCLNADQGDRYCDDYEVRFLCAD